MRGGNEYSTIVREYAEWNAALGEADIEITRTTCRVVVVHVMLIIQLNRSENNRFAQIASYNWRHRKHCGQIKAENLLCRRILYTKCMFNSGWMKLINVVLLPSTVIFIVHGVRVNKDATRWYWGSVNEEARKRF